MDCKPAFLAPIRSQKQRSDRLLCVVTGEPEWLNTQQRVIASSLQGIYCFGDEGEGGYPLSHAKSFLGQSLPNVVVDVRCGFNPNAIAALSGCVAAGGVLVLLIPTFSRWPFYDCPDYQRMAVHGIAPSSYKRFLARCARILAGDPRVLFIQQDQPFRLARCEQHQVVRYEHDVYRSQCQQNAVQAVLNVANGHRNRPLVINAARGRGKSASLGLAANMLLAQGKQPVLVAPSKAAVASVYQQLSVEQHVDFYPPDAFDRVLPMADVVLVDEAAAISVPLLQRWATHYSRIVFSSTSFGYEGHGQGFITRFLPALAAVKPQYQYCELVQAIRFQTPCSVEQVFDDMFIMGESAPYTHPSKREAYCDQISQQQLFEDEELLRAVYQLLLSAHYQTTPDDVRVLLDGLNTQVFACFDDGQLMSVALLAEEGDLESALHTGVFNGTRRVRGHLAPQFLTVNGSHSAWCEQKLWRVVRIASSPNHTRQGYASRLMHYVEQTAAAAEVAAIVAVFGLAPEVVPFWRSNGFQLACINNKLDSVSAQLTGAVIKPINDAARQLVQAQQTFCYDQLLQVIQLQAASLNLQQVLGLLKGLPFSGCLVEHDLAVLQAFGDESKPLHACLPSLRQWMLVSAETEAIASQSGYKALVLYLLLNRPWAMIAKELGLTGQKPIVTAMRTAVNHASTRKCDFTS